MTARTPLRAMPAIDTGARDEAETHPGYQTMPMLAADDRDALERSIRTHGIQTPIIVDEAGAIIDGHHRFAISEYLGIECPRIMRTGMEEGEKIALSISLNVDRRQLTQAQKRDIIAASLKAQPEKSDRGHAKATGASHHTVAAVRAELEESGDVGNLPTRTDSTGRQQPASKPLVSIKTKRTEETTETFDAQTGELLDSPAPAAGDVAVAVGTSPESPATADPIGEYLSADEKLARVQYDRAFHKAVKDAGKLALFDAERVALVADAHTIRALEDHVAMATKFLAKVRTSRSGLRLIEGGKK